MFLVCADGPNVFTQKRQTDCPWLKKACKALKVLIDMSTGEAGLLIFKIHVCTFAFLGDKYQCILDTFLFTLCSMFNFR